MIYTNNTRCFIEPVVQKLVSTNPWLKFKPMVLFPILQEKN